MEEEFTFNVYFFNIENVILQKKSDRYIET